MTALIISIAISILFVLVIVERSRLARVRKQPAAASSGQDIPAITGKSLLSPKDVCEHLAATLEANAIVIERLRGELLVVAGSPWKSEIQPVDRIALDWSFTTGLPPKSGNGNPFGSDWLFLPVKVDGRVAAILGVAARHARRRFIVDEQPTIRSSVNALRRIYRTEVPASGWASDVLPVSPPDPAARAVETRRG